MYKFASSSYMKISRIWSAEFMRIRFLLLLLCPLCAWAQETAKPTDPFSAQEPKPGARYVRPKYYELGAGFDIASFRDLATSPLTYSGVGGEFTANIIRRDAAIENVLGFTVASGTYLTSPSPGETTVSSAQSLFVRYMRLFRVNPHATGKWNMKVGGMFDFTTNLRQNPALLNASTGFEIVHTIFLTGKVTRDISRKEERRRKIWFVKFTQKPKDRELAFQLSPSLINSTYRNGFAYLGQSAVIGSKDYLKHYEFSGFSGFRVKTQLDYTRYLKNGNGIRYSYIWDAYKTGGSLPKFEMAHHMLQLALMFRVK